MPFHSSVRAVKVEFELMFSMVRPTDQHAVALAQVAPSTMSSEPVVGAVTIFHPAGAATARPVWNQEDR